MADVKNEKKDIYDYFDLNKKEDVNACDTNTFLMAAVQTKMKFDKISIL